MVRKSRFDLLTWTAACSRKHFFSERSDCLCRAMQSDYRTQNRWVLERRDTKLNPPRAPRQEERSPRRWHQTNATADDENGGNKSQTMDSRRAGRTQGATGRSRVVKREWGCAGSPFPLDSCHSAIAPNSARVDCKLKVETLVRV